MKDCINVKCVYHKKKKKISVIGKMDLIEKVFYGLPEPLFLHGISPIQNEEEIVFESGDEKWVFYILPNVFEKIFVANLKLC